MKLVIFGLTISSSWGNGHATLWRGLCRALAQAATGRLLRARRPLLRHQPRPARAPRHRPAPLYELGGGPRRGPPGARGRRRGDGDLLLPGRRRGLRAVLGRPARLTVFYDLDTPVTLERLSAGEKVPYLPAEGLGGFDLVLSYTGGRALDELRERLGARRWPRSTAASIRRRTARPLPSRSSRRISPISAPTPPTARRRSSGSFWSRPGGCRRSGFVIGGAQYPGRLPLGDQRLLRPPPAAGGPPGLLRLLAPDPQRDAGGHGWNGLLPLRPAVRGGRLRHGRALRPLGGARPLLRAGPGDLHRAAARRRCSRSSPSPARRSTGSPAPPASGRSPSTRRSGGRQRDGGDAAGGECPA